MMAAVQRYGPALREFFKLGEDVKLWIFATRGPLRSFLKEMLA
jgi:hypothetical protein